MTSLAGKYWPYNLNVQKGGSGLDAASVFLFDLDEALVVDVLTDSQGDIVEQDMQELLTTINGGLVQTQKTPHALGILKWLHNPFVTPITFIAARRDQYPVNDANNNFITELTQATVDGYTGGSVSDPAELVTLTGGGGTPIDRWARLYDWLRSRAINTPQPPPYLAGIVTTADGNVFPFGYALTIDGFAFDGQGKTISMESGKVVTLQGAGGNISSFAIQGQAATADLVLGAGIGGVTFSALDVTGDVNLTNAGAATRVLDACTWGSVSSTVAGQVLQLINGSSIAVNNDPGNITIEQNVPVSVTVLDDETDAPLEGRRVRLVTQASVVVLDNVVTDVNGQAQTTFNYGGGPDQPIDPAKSFARGGQRTPLYESRPLRGAISATGYDVTVGLRKG